MVEQAIQLSADFPQRDRVNYAVGSIERLNFPEASVDGILCSSVLEYVDSPAGCLREFARVLRLQGRMVLSVPNARSGLRIGLRSAYAVTKFAGRGWPKWLELSRHQFSREGILRLLADSGFRADAMEAFGLSMPLGIQKVSLVGPLWMISATRE